MNCKHHPEIPKCIKKGAKNIQRQAIAPYNFVELPEKIVEILPESLPQENCYYLQSADPFKNRYTGRIECILTTESPLYIRCGLTKEEFNCGAETKDLPDFFYTNYLKKFTSFAIPGSSLRGMLRSLVEIITFSKIGPVSNNQRLFFRAVAANPKEDSLGKAYKKYILPKNIEAGYLKQDNEGWYIQPAKREKRENGETSTFAWVKETNLNLEELIKFDDPDYRPQYIPVSYREVSVDQNDIAKRLFASDVDKPDAYPTNKGVLVTSPTNKGVLVTSGNMKQGDSDQPSTRRNHCLVFDSDSSAKQLRLDNKAVNYYRNALTDFQKEEPFDKNWGVLNENCSVIFYCPPESGKQVVLFGQSPNFRIPYIPKSDECAATVTDFIPPDLNNTSKIDLADAIFGWVKQDEKKELPENIRQRAGRVFITDAQYKSNESGIWYKGNFNDTVTPQILSEPKPTCFQHYLVQPKKGNPQADKQKLKHYGSLPESETVIRGHKLYWHKGNNPRFQHPNGDDVEGTQVTKIKPINPGVKFEFTIHFENLNNIELGSLLWILDIAQRKERQYRLKLGMGKPLGMGAIKIEPKLYLSNREQRYSKLFNIDSWEKGEPQNPSEDLSKYKENFEKELITQLHNNDTYQDFQEFNEIPRVKMLLAMLVWEQDPLPQYLEQRRYMEIKREKQPRINDPNEYKERPVLPTPLQLMGWEDKHRTNAPSSSPSNSGNPTNTPKPILRGKKNTQPIKQDNQSPSEGSNSAAIARPPKPKK